MSGLGSDCPCRVTVLRAAAWCGTGRSCPAAESEVVFTCLNKNVLLLGAHEFEQLGAGKVLFNTSIGPGFDSKALENWLNLPNTHFFCDTYAAAGPVAKGFFARENVRCPGSSAGRTKQAFVLLSEKVLANIETALAE